MMSSMVRLDLRELEGEELTVKLLHRIWSAFAVTPVLPANNFCSFDTSTWLIGAWMKIP